MRAEAFAAALRDPARPAPAGFGSTEGPRRFAVYRNNVAVSLADALEATYPAVAALVGRAFLRAAAREFARAAPPRSPVLIDWGGGFARFLAAFPPAASLPYLPDVARLEWAWTRAYNAADAAPADVSALSARPPEALAGARLALHPSLRLVRSRWSVVALWAETTGRAEGRSRAIDRPQTALVLRPDMAVSVDALAPGDDAFLWAIAEGATIGAAADAAAPHAGFDLGESFVRLFGAGAFTGFAAEGARPCTGRSAP